MTMHNWVLMYVGPTWSDWLCSRCKQQVVVALNTNPNRDHEAWRIQNKRECDDEIVISIHAS
jgi:hypothetical protein